MAVIQNSTSLRKGFVFWGGGAYTATSSAAGYPAINAGTQDTYSSWKPNVTGASNIVIDKGADVVINAIGIAAHNMFSSGVTIAYCATSPDNATWTNRGNVNILSDEDFILTFQDVSARYVRVAWSGPAANIGVFQAGKRIDFESAAVLDYTPIQHSVNYEKEFNQSITGQKLTNRVIAQGAQTNANFAMTSAAFVEGAMLPFELWYNQGGCFFYAGAPTLMPKDMGYACAANSDDILGVNYIAGGKYANISFSMDVYRGA